MVGAVDTYMSQNAPTFTTGPRGGTPVVNGAAQNTTYDLTGANTQTLITNGWTAAAAARVAVGDVFTIANVFDVNPVTKATLPILKQFVVATGSTLASDGSGNLTLTIAPQIISSGAQQNVSAVPANSAVAHLRGIGLDRLRAEPDVRQERLRALHGSDGAPAGLRRLLAHEQERPVGSCHPVLRWH
jgi:hypothetical protein